MTARPKIILFELNEVPFRVIDDFCARHPNSVLARVLPRAAQYVTRTDDEPLSPWITWPTLHRGVDIGKHGIAHLGMDTTKVDEEFPPIWMTLAARGLRVGVFGSLHSYPAPTEDGEYAFYVPDTFAADGRCIPSSIDTFQNFNLNMARKSVRNVATQVLWKEGLKVLVMAPRLGLRANTLLSVAQQLLVERFRPMRRVRRRTYQTILGCDVFMKLVADTRPDFATFFTNHVASSMHRYWAAAYPEDYEDNNYSLDWRSTFADEIDFTMSKTDHFLGRLVRFVDRNPSYRLWVASSMGQGPTVAEPIATQLYVTDLARFMGAMGLTDSEDWHMETAMFPEVSVYIVPTGVDAFRDSLEHLVIDGRPLRFAEKTGGFFSLSFGHVNLHDKPQVVVLRQNEVAFERLGLSPVPIEDTANSNAYHVPEGLLFVYDPTTRSSTEERVRIPLTAVHEMILDAYSDWP